MSPTSDDPPLRSLVIGAGVISDPHLHYLASSPRAELVAVCDLSSAMARVAAERFGAPCSATDYQVVLARECPDVVHVLTPPATHDRIVRDCLAAGCHVIVEKPIALDHASFASLWQAAEQAGRRLVENQNYRFNEPVLEMERLAADGTLGEITDVEVRLQLPITSGGRYSDRNLPHPSHGLPCGVIHEFISHLVYLTLRFLPEGSPEEERVCAAWSNHSGEPLFRFDDLDALVIRGTTHGRIRFSARSAPDCFRVTVRGSRGAASCDLFLPRLELDIPRAGGQQLSPLINQFSNGLGAVRASATNFLSKVKQKTPLEGLGTFLDRTYAALADGSELPVTYDDMASTTRMIDKLLADEARL